MGWVSQLFEIDQLEKLDEKELQILRDIIQHEIRTNPKILNALREKTGPAYDKLTKKKK